MTPVLNDHVVDQQRAPRQPSGPEVRQEQRRDLQAAVEARRELGPEYEPQLIESFLDHLDRDIDRRLGARFAGRRLRSRGSDPSIPIALGSLGLGIPLSAIAGDAGGLGGLLATWVGITAVNAAHAWGRRRGGS